MAIGKEGEESSISADLAHQAKAALCWCVEEIGKASGENGVVEPAILAKIEEINALIAELAKAITPENNAVAPYPVQEFEYKLADGRAFKVKRI